MRHVEVWEFGRVDRDQTIDILRSACEGNGDAASVLLKRVYDELRGLAEQAMRRERSNHTLQPTVLVHEAFLKLIHQDNPDWKSRAHFLAVAAKQMRRILIDHARNRDAAKRGGAAQTMSLQSHDGILPDRVIDILALNEALDRLAQFNPTGADVVELRFFAGLTIPEVAEVLQVSERTIAYKWESARAWLASALRAGDTAV